MRPESCSRPPRIEPGSASPLAFFAPLKAALETQTAATAVVEVDNELFQMVAVPVLGPDVIGFLLLGQAIDDRVASRLQQDTHSEVTFLTSSKVFASSWPSNDRGHPQSAAQLPALLLEMRRHNPQLLTIGGERYLSLIVPIDAHLAQPLYVLIQGSYDRALAPLHTLQWRIATIGTIALAGALITGILLAGGITGPVRLLVSAMHEIPRGNLRHRIQIDRNDEIGFLSRSFNEMAEGLEEREHIKDTFGRFVSRDVAEAVLSGRVPLAGERREVSILFQDIRGFTALSEKLDPVALLLLLNRFFTEVVAAVEAEGGVVKQFTGDGVMALFGAPQSRADHTDRAVRAALGIVTRLARLNALLQARRRCAASDWCWDSYRGSRSWPDRSGRAHRIWRGRRASQSREPHRSAHQGTHGDHPGVEGDRGPAGLGIRARAHGVTGREGKVAAGGKWLKCCRTRCTRSRSRKDRADTAGRPADTSPLWIAAHRLGGQVGIRAERSQVRVRLGQTDHGKRACLVLAVEWSRLGGLKLQGGGAASSGLLNQKPTWNVSVGASFTSGSKPKIWSSRIVLMRTWPRSLVLGNLDVGENRTQTSAAENPNRMAVG